MPFLPFLHRVVEGRHLSEAEAEQAMDAVFSGIVTTPQLAAFLVALRMKGETVDELTGFARSLRSHSLHVSLALGGEPLLDTCGTGGDGLNTFNISTVSAFVVAGAGVAVAKHGNRAATGDCGSADILEMMGVRLQSDPEQIGQTLAEHGIAFLFAPALHPAMKLAAPARAQLRLRTVFNLLGPLSNPAGATVQLVGASSPAAAELMAGALSRLGLQRGLVVHGSDGLDEITTTGETLVFELRNGKVSCRELSPESFGLPRAALSDLQSASRKNNLDIALGILNGIKGPQRDIVLANAAAALHIAGKAESLRDGVAQAARSIDSGAALGRLQVLADKSHN